MAVAKGSAQASPHTRVRPSMWRAITDDDAYLAVVRAYNDYLAKDYCSVAPDRLIGLGSIPWTGVNDAMRYVPVDKFRETVIAGVDELQRAGIDVVLLDMQYFPKAEKVRDFPRFLVAMRQIAEQRRIPILQRFAIMKNLVTSAQYTPQQLLAADQFHPNDFSYGCLGRFMAEALQGEVADVGKAVAKKKYPAEAAKQAGAVAPVPVH